MTFAENIRLQLTCVGFGILVTAMTQATSAQQPIQALKISTSSTNSPLLRNEPHVLAPLLKDAEEHLDFIHNTINNYSCYLVKRERIDGHLLPTEHMFVKFRSPRQSAVSFSPYSVYVKYLAPASAAGREVLFVQGKHDGDVIVKKGGRRNAQLTLRLNPEGRMAMRDNKYSIKDFGFENLLQRLIEVARQDMAFENCTVRTLPGAKIDGRSCTIYEVTHPIQQAQFTFHLARIFIDDEMQIPIRYASYDWPEVTGGKPRLIEEYTYRDVKLNLAMSDTDFDPRNPEYGFSEYE